MSLQALLYSADGSQKGTFDLPASLFGVDIRPDLIHRLLMLQRHNARQTLAHTKTRGEVTGSTRKLYQQKKTGNARAGASRSPVRRGGGVIFGPRNERNFTISMNKKERRLALFSLLSSKAVDSRIAVIESFNDSVIKTKTFIDVAAKMNLTSAVIAALPTDTHIFQGARNIPTIKAIGVNYLNPNDLLKFQSLVFTTESLKHLTATYSA